MRNVPGSTCDRCEKIGEDAYDTIAAYCHFCERYLCDTCATFTSHKLVSEWDEDRAKRFDCEDLETPQWKLDALADAATLRLFAHEHFQMAWPLALEAWATFGASE